MTSDADKTTGDVTVRVVTDVVEWEALQAAWGDLWRASGNASTPLRWDWLREWWRAYGETYSVDGLRIVLFEHLGRLIGAMPLYVGRNAESPVGPMELRFLSTGEARWEETCAAYLDILCPTAHADDCAAAFFDALSSGLITGWDCLQLSCVAPRSSLLKPAAGVPVKCTWLPERQGPCLTANIAGGVDAYLGRLSANTRAQARRVLRSLDRSVAFQIASTAEEIDRFYSELVELHQRRWRHAGQQGCFASPRFTAFHRAVAGRLVHTREVVIARLSMDGRPLAVIQGYVTGNKFDYYLSGRTIDEAHVKSPGIAAHLCLKIFLSERGITEYDYLHGYSRHKAQYSTDSHRIWQIAFERRTFRGLTHSLWQTGKSAAREARRVAYRAVSSHTE